MEEYTSLDNDDRMNCGNPGVEAVDFEVTLLEPRPFRPFKTSEEYLYAMKEDLAEWLNGLYEGLDLTADSFLEQMETGVILCQHANNVVRKAREYYKTIGAPAEVPVPDRDVVYRSDVLPETFHARDNVSNFISWCRALAIKECLLFETDDLVLRKNERSFILCLLEVARKGAKFGMPAPLLVQLEQEIDAELANDDGYQSTLDHHRVQVVTNDLRSLHERVVELLSRCTCPSQFPMIRVADGKYRIGDTKVLIFVRILRSHVMVRVGGGWDTLEHYLDKHDPCRCRSGHRLSTSAKLTMHHGKSSIPSMYVTYDRPPQPTSVTPTSSPKIHRRSISHQHHNQIQYCSPYHAVKSTRNESPPRYLHQVSSSTATHCSDDSSASNPSLHDSSSMNNTANSNRKLQKKKNQLHGQRNHSAGSTSEDVSDEDDLPADILPRSPQMSIRQRMAKRDSLKGTVPSSWQYTPVHTNNHFPTNNVLVPRKSSNGVNKPTVAIAGISNGTTSCLTKLPSLTSRAKNQSPPPRVLKVSPNVQQQEKWSEQKSQSSEDLFQDSNSGPAADRNLIFHSRGTSPVNIKGRQSVGFSHRLDTPKDLLPTSFRRCDPVRHSSYHTPRNYGKTKAPQRSVQSAELKKAPQVNRYKGPLLPRQGSPPRKYPPNPTYKKTSPILEKLLQRSDLCADAHFMKKIEMLITEYESKSDLMNMRFDNQTGLRSLPTDIQQKIDSASYPRRSSKDVDGKMPSKIPIPTWQ